MSYVTQGNDFVIKIMISMRDANLQSKHVTVVRLD